MQPGGGRCDVARARRLVGAGVDPTSLSSLSFARCCSTLFSTLDFPNHRHFKMYTPQDLAVKLCFNRLRVYDTQRLLRFR